MRIIKNNNIFIDEETGLIIEPRFQNYTCPEDYIKAGVKGVCPMTAKEEDREEELEKMLAANSGYFVEEKLDGTRGTLHFFKENYPKQIGYTRCFSRRISKQTNWYCENTDSLPQIRDLDFAELDGIIIDGELFIPGQPFKAVASTLNCLWGKAIERQLELGMLVFHAFDIIFYKGVYIARMPLWKRKQYLQKIIDKINSPYIKMVQYSDSYIQVGLTYSLYKNLLRSEYSEVYPCMQHNILHRQLVTKGDIIIDFSKRGYYEYIVASGGEGIIIKDKNGKYYHKRGREYTKLKKFITRDVILIRFNPPTKKSKGEFPKDKWAYWIFEDEEYLDVNLALEDSAKNLVKLGWTPVTKYYYENWVGNIVFGVVITQQEKQLLLKSKKSKEFIFHTIDTLEVLEVGECSGMTEEQRELFTVNRKKSLNTVVEIKANGIFKDTGKLRHPRFLRTRFDKAIEQCTWKDHIGEG